MNYQTIGEIYEANAKIRQKLKAKIENLSEEQTNLRLNDSGWTIGEIIEHIAIVEFGMATICSRLLQKSVEENIPNDGTANISAEFLEKAALIANRRERKAQAPERVLPSGNLSIADSLAKMEETSKILEQIRTGLETVNTQKYKFPHPFFGDMSATEWLALVGGHEFRHIDQIEEILSA
ncbi:MAG: DinB family protein [Acidobacteriota bacterium]